MGKSESRNCAPGNNDTGHGIPEATAGRLPFVYVRFYSIFKFGRLAQLDRAPELLRVRSSQ